MLLFVLPLALFAKECLIILPADLLSAGGLSSLFFVGNCDQNNVKETCFAEATIFDPDTLTMMVYHPLLVNLESTPAIPPKVPEFSAGSVMCTYLITTALTFSTNADSITLSGPGRPNGNCVNGDGNSNFGQFASCNNEKFFQTVRDTNFVVPSIGIASNNEACLTVRDFALVDKTQSDGVITTYIITEEAKLAQNTKENRDALTNDKILFQIAQNSGDNSLLLLMDGITGCTPFTVPNAIDSTSSVGSLVLNELFAKVNQKSPIALLPENALSAKSNGEINVKKMNAYRAEVGQVQNIDSDGTQYCINLATIASKRISLDSSLTSKADSPDTAIGDNMFTFLCARFEDSFGNDGLDCAGLLGVDSPITAKKDAAGVATDCTIVEFNQNDSRTPSVTNQEKSFKEKMDQLLAEINEVQALFDEQVRNGVGAADGVQDEIDVLRSRLNDINQKPFTEDQTEAIQTLQTDIEDLRETLTTQNGSGKTVQDQINGLQASLNILNNDPTKSSDVQIFQEEIKEIQTTLDILTAVELSGDVNQAERDRLDSQIAALQQALEEGNASGVSTADNNGDGATAEVRSNNGDGATTEVGSPTVTVVPTETPPPDDPPVPNPNPNVPQELQVADKQEIDPQALSSKSNEITAKLLVSFSVALFLL